MPHELRAFSPPPGGGTGRGLFAAPAIALTSHASRTSRLLPSPPWGKARERVPYRACASRPSHPHLQFSLTPAATSHPSAHPAHPPAYTSSSHRRRSEYRPDPPLQESADHF